jgi:hypothetical protein
MQRYTIYLFRWNAVPASGDSSAHHLELKIVYTVSGICQNFSAACRYRESFGTLFQLFHDSGR